eukprot:9519561-Ditylum_brightwellii.AAC.1
MACLMEIGPGAMCVEIDIPTMVKKYNLVTPSVDYISTCDDEDVLEALETSDQRSAMANLGWSSFTPAPFDSNSALGHA